MDNVKYFLTVIRYIHQNPIKAGIEKDIVKYPWSSYNEYFKNNGICDTKFVLSLFSKDEKRAIILFQEFNTQKNNDECLEFEEQIRINDVEARKLILEVAGAEDPRQIQYFEKENRDQIIKELKNRGLSIRQIERLTGVRFSVIRRL